MQTFLPFPPELNKQGKIYSFKNSARILDNRRLSKQRIEGYQILQVLSFNGITDKPRAWSNHPALLQWKGYEWSLFNYICDICLVWKEECGFQDTIYNKLDDLTIPGSVQEVLHPTLPPWMGDIDFHRSHRSRLLFKGRVDAALATLKIDLGIKKPNVWLKENGYSKSNVFTYDDIIRLETYMVHTGGLQRFQPNHYFQFGWEEPDNLPYVWPVRKNVATT